VPCIYLRPINNAESACLSVCLCFFVLCACVGYTGELCKTGLDPPSVRMGTFEGMTSNVPSAAGNVGVFQLTGCTAAMRPFAKILWKLVITALRYSRPSCTVFMCMLMWNCELQSVVLRQLGMDWIGYVMASYAVVDVIVSFILAAASLKHSHLSRSPVVLLLLG